MYPNAHRRPQPRVLRTLTGVGQPPHVLHPMSGFGAAVPLLHFNMNPAWVQCIKPVANGGQGGKWVGDQVTGSCQVPAPAGPGGIPMWAIIAGSAVVVGGAAWFFLGRD